MELWTTGCLLPLHINDELGEEWKYKWHSLSEEFLSPWLKTSYHQLSGSLYLLHLVSVELLWKLMYMPPSSSVPWLALQGDWRIRVLGWVTSLKFQYQFWLRSYKSHKNMLCISTGKSPTNWKQKTKIDSIRWIDARLMKVGLNKNFKTLKLIQELHLLEGLALLQLQRASSSTLLTTWTLFARVQDLIDGLKIYSEKTTLESVKFCY